MAGLTLGRDKFDTQSLGEKAQGAVFERGREGSKGEKAGPLSGQGLWGSRF